MWCIYSSLEYKQIAQKQTHTSYINPCSTQSSGLNKPSVTAELFIVVAHSDTMPFKKHTGLNFKGREGLRENGDFVMKTVISSAYTMNKMPFHKEQKMHLEG